MRRGYRDPDGTKISHLLYINKIRELKCGQVVREAVGDGWEGGGGAFNMMSVSPRETVLGTRYLAEDGN